MTDFKLPPIDILDFKAERYSPDGKAIVVSFATKYSAERRSYSLPVESLYGFIADLQKLQRPSVTAPATDAPATPSKSKTAGPPAGGDFKSINVRVPKKWMLRTGLPAHPLVIMVFDPQTELQAGFALTEKAAREMAAGLTKQANSLTNGAANRPKPN
jgi:hypothetical protein